MFFWGVLLPILSSSPEAALNFLHCLGGGWERFCGEARIHPWKCSLLNFGQMTFNSIMFVFSNRFRFNFRPFSAIQGSSQIIRNQGPRNLWKSNPSDSLRQLVPLWSARSGLCLLWSRDKFPTANASLFPFHYKQIIRLFQSWIGAQEIGLQSLFQQTTHEIALKSSQRDHIELLSFTFNKN